MPYHRGSKLDRLAVPLSHSLEATVKAAVSDKRPAGLSFYEEDGSNLVYLSYVQLRSHAQRLAERLKQAVNGATPRLLVDPDLPRCDLFVAFWACIYAEICPCFLGCAGARSQRAWEMLGSPPLLFNSQKSRSRLGSAQTAFNAVDLAELPAQAPEVPAPHGEVESVEPMEVTKVAFQVVTENDESDLVLYSYSHDSIWANSLGMKQIFSDPGTSLKCLSWMPMSPFTLLWHCAAVFHAASEIHVDLTVGPGALGAGDGESEQGLDPCSSLAPWHFLRCLRRHAGKLVVAAPLNFYRRLGRPFHSFGKVRWLLLSGDDWQMEDLRTLLSHQEEQKQDPLEFQHLLVAPWGAALAHCPLGSDLFSSPFPGVELRQWPLMARGLQALPGTAQPGGWRSLRGAKGALQPEQLRISGVEYTSAEVETALELSPLVCPGSTVACSAHGNGLVIFFVPKDGTISSRDALVKSLAAHLALSLGLHVQRLVPLPAAALPRTADGTVRREVVKRWLKEGVSVEDAPLPADWVFEEDFKAQALASNVEVDEDAIEERMEGAALDPDVHSPKRLLLIIHGGSSLSEQVLSTALGRADGTGDGTTLRAVDSTEEALAVMQTLEGLELMVLHLLQCEDSQGTKEVVSVIQLLQAWEKKHSSLNSKVPVLKLLCVSTGRHMRVAGDAMDPRKHFLSGVLLSAALELPWLRVCQLDACPKLRGGLLAELLLQEMSSDLDSSEVLLDADGARLVRRLRPAALAPQNRLQVLMQCRSILLAGGAGGIGALWAEHLSADAVLLLGRRPQKALALQRRLERLRRGNSEIVYISADISKKQQLLSALKNCPAMNFLDFAACLCESFEPPQSVLQLDAQTAMNGPQEKLRGAENFIEVLKELTSSTSPRARHGLPVLFTSSAVSVAGAPQLGVYGAKARALEALCTKEAAKASAQRRKTLEIGCVALSAWDHVGITAAFPALASNAPALGLKTLTPQQGLEALEAVLRFQAPRFTVLMVGVDGQHPRVQALTGGSSAGAATSTATVSGCVEMIQAAVRKVLGKEANLGDSFVELGLDSMSSMSLHSTLSDCSGVVLPLSLFYDEPSLLDAAKYLHGAAAPSGGVHDGNDEENLEALLQDDEARRSYQLSQGRSAMNAKDFHLARDKCRAAAVNATGPALIAARSLEAEACHALGDAAMALELLREVLRAEEELHGAESAESCLALGKLIHLGATDQRPDFQRHHRRFLEAVAWVATATKVEAVAAAGGSWEMQRLRWLNLDLQKLDGFPKDELGALGGLEVLEVMTLRRNGLTELPSSFGQLQTLRELYLTGNCLSDLPESFCNLSKLQVLCLERNRLVKLPSAIYAISKRLLQLGLDEQEVPFSLDEPLLIPKLSILRARGCQAATFPKMLLGSKGAANLNTVFWANNGLFKLPDLQDVSVAEALRSLRLLDLAHNQITSMIALTMSEFSLRHLRDLSLAGNRLTEIPAEIAQALPSLQQLWLHGNQLRHLPEELGELHSLAILELHHNQLLELPRTMGKLQKLNWFFAHGNELTDVHIIKTLNTLPRLKIVGLGCNKIPLQQIDFHSLHASYGLGWNLGIAAADEVLTEALTTTDLHWDRLVSDEVQQLLVITFSAQGAPVAQGQAEVRALRDAMLKVDALYVCDPANAWFLQDPTFQWKGLEYFEQKISSITSKYRRVFAWGGSMGGSASLLFAHLVDRVHAFSPQVDLAFTWPTFGTAEVRDQFRRQVQDSVSRCRGKVHLHVGAENHTDNRHAAALALANVHLHETANHNTMKHVKQRGKLLPLLKFEVMDLLIQ